MVTGEAEAEAAARQAAERLSGVDCAVLLFAAKGYGHGGRKAKRSEAKRLQK